MGKSKKHSVLGWSAAIALCVAVAGCDSPDTDAAGNSAGAGPPQGEHSTTSTRTAADRSTATGPDILSTTGLHEGTPPTRVDARHGLFTIETIEGADTLIVNGKAARYSPDGANTPIPVAANSSITLVGVFELPLESVAWVVIGGGTACPGTHVLVGTRSGLALPGREIPGCDDRGTMRRAGDKIAFEAGGSEGTYQDGMISIVSKPPDDTGAASAGQP